MKIKNKYSDLWVEIDNETGWTQIIAENGDVSVSLGKYPNKRFEVLEKMFQELKSKEKN